MICNRKTRRLRKQNGAFNITCSCSRPFPSSYSFPSHRSDEQQAETRWSLLIPATLTPIFTFSVFTGVLPSTFELRSGQPDLPLTTIGEVPNVFKWKHEIGSG
ncbi:hypothetical protein L6164_001721 [Bauhinia variegata]|uniref:Uncharacterized protein n=1 Tax=Bauhinia variegata TaxID=167791 RepID=A0ACB9QAY9_BAUVA|nr:hypothetical protein L6164_001721 [Bauhinia variegata]